MFKNILIITSIAFISFSSAHAQTNTPILLNDANNNGVERFRIGPNSQYVIFNEFNLNDDLNRFSSNIDSPLPLNSLATSLTSSERAFFIDEDDSRLLSRDESTGGLLSSSFNGQSMFQLPAPNNESVRLFSGFNDNTDFQVFRTEEGNLYSIKSDGTSSAVLLSEGLIVNHFRITPDRLTMLFSAETSNGNHTVFSTSIDGSTEAKPIHVLPANSIVQRRPNISVDSSRAIYIIETFSDNNIQTLQLYSTPIDGSSPPSKLGDSISGDSVNIDFELSDNGEFVAFRQRVFSAIFLDDFNQLYTTPTDGSGTPTFIDSAENIIRFDITNDSQNIIYSTQNVFFELDLFSAPFDRSTLPVGIAPPIDPFSGPFTRFDINPIFRISGDSKFVFYTARNSTNLDEKLYRAPSNGLGESIEISKASQVDEFDVDSINSRVFYSSSDSGVSSNQLSSVNFDGTNNSTLATPDTRINSLRLSPDNNLIVYTTESNTNDSELLFVLDISSNLLVPEETCFPIKTKTDDVTIICF